MINIKLACEELEHTTKKSHKEVKKTIQSILSLRPNISYMQLILVASSKLIDENKKDEDINKLLKDLPTKWRRNW